MGDQCEEGGRGDFLRVLLKPLPEPFSAKVSISPSVTTSRSLSGLAVCPLIYRAGFFRICVFLFFVGSSVYCFSAVEARQNNMFRSLAYMLRLLPFTTGSGVGALGATSGVRGLSCVIPTSPCAHISMERAMLPFADKAGGACAAAVAVRVGL